MIIHVDYLKQILLYAYIYKVGYAGIKYQMKSEYGDKQQYHVSIIMIYVNRFDNMANYIISFTAANRILCKSI